MAAFDLSKTIQLYDVIFDDFTDFCFFLLLTFGYSLLSENFPTGKMSITV